MTYISADLFAGPRPRGFDLQTRISNLTLQPGFIPFERTLTQSLADSVQSVRLPLFWPVFRVSYIAIYEGGLAFLSSA